MCVLVEVRGGVSCVYQCGLVIFTQGVRGLIFWDSAKF